MKSIRRSPWLALGSLLTLAIMIAPLAIAASTISGPELLSGGAMCAMLPCFLRGPLFEEAEGGAGSGGAKADPIDPKAAIAQVENTSLPIGQRLTIAINALRGIDPTQQLADINTKLTTATNRVKELETSEKALQQKIKDLEASNVTFADKARTLETENADLKTKEQDISKRADALVKEKLGALGINHTNLPPSNENEPPATGAKSIYERFAKETNSETKAALYSEYKAALAKEKKPTA